MDITAFLITIVLGPVMFAFWSRWVYRHRETCKWPLGLVDSVGDGVFLPLFNGFAFAGGLMYVPERFVIAAIGGVAIALVSYRIARRTPTNWSKTEDSHLNAGGWYHLAFLGVQSGIIIYALMSHPTSLLLWTPLAAFAITLLSYFAFELPCRTRRGRYAHRGG
jgi:hypothetical protein